MVPPAAEAKLGSSVPVTQYLLALQEAAAGDADVCGLGHILLQLSPTPRWSRSSGFSRVWESNPVGSRWHIGMLWLAVCSSAAPAWDQLKHQELLVLVLFV